MNTTLSELEFRDSEQFRNEKFTGKERDQETRLDFFGARYMSGAQGRFTSSDRISGWPSQPQSWNQYAYGLNNPIRYIDPTGMFPRCEREFL